MNRIEKINELLLSAPSDCFLLHALGLEYLKINELNKSLDSFYKVLEIDENYVGTYYHLAKTLELVKRNEDAITMYEQGIKIALKLKDMHAKNELQMALEDLLDE